MHAAASPPPASSSASRARASRAPSSASSVGSSSSAASAAASLAASSTSSPPAAQRLSNGAFQMTVDRVKLAHSASIAIAAHRMDAPTAADTAAMRGAAILVPNSALQIMDMHAGQQVWITHALTGWHALAHVWPAEKVLRTGCRLLLPSHASCPLVDGSLLQLQPVLQPITRASTIRIQPDAHNSAHILAGESTGSKRMQQVMSSVLTAVLADRYVFVGESVAVTLFDEEYSFIVASIEPSQPPAHLLTSAATATAAPTEPRRTTAGESKEEKEVEEKLVSGLQRIKIAAQQSSATAAASAAPSSFPALYSVSSHTRVLLISAAPSSTNDASVVPSNVIDSDAIGGLETEIAALRELITLPLLQPHLFTTFGIKPPKGILLYGPPGTGKTMLARAVAQQTFSSFYLINGPEIISKFVGESEEKLASVFALARRHAPSIIFLDELDSLCPKRDESSDELQKRIVASLLTLMDGLSSSSSGGGEGGSHSSVDDRVLVIGATNRPDALDTAMRRAGRFDREMEIGIPNEPKRLDILGRMIRNMPHSLSPQELSHVASVTHGYVGADLKAVCREAALVALSRWQQQQPDWMDQLQSAAPSVASSSSSLVPASNAHASLHLILADFLAALPSVKPSAMRSLVIDVPKVAWTDIGGQEDVKQKLKEAVDWPLMHPEAFLRLGIQPPKGILLYGPPGCSKTLMAKALANESSRNFIAVKGPELFSKWVGESEKAVKEIFRKARAAAPSIVFFDEIDSIAASRGDGGGGEGGERVAHRVLSQLLTELDGIEPLKQVTILAATNRPDLIDAALLRPGRIDRILYVSPPDERSCGEILAIEFRRIGAAAAALLPVPSAISARCFSMGLSGAEIAALVREAALVAMEADLHANTLTLEHFEEAFKRTTPRITKEMIKFYTDYAAKSSVASV